MQMTSIPAPPSLIEPRASPAGTFLKKSLSHSLVEFAKNSEPLPISQQRRVTKHNSKPLKCLTSNDDSSKKQKKIVRRAHSFDDSNHIPSSPRRATNKKEYLKSQSLPVQKPNVTFSHQNSIYEIERIRDVPSIEDSDIWWTTKDYLEIKQEYEAVIYLLEQNMEVNELEHSARGLDKRTERGAWTLFEYQRNARHAVLKQQDIQRKLKYVDEQAIARAYMQENSALVLNAIQVAAKDAEIAMEFLHPAEASREKMNQLSKSDDVANPPITPVSPMKESISSSKMASQRSLHPQSPTCWHDSMGFVGCHKAQRSQAAIHDSIVDSYLAAFQQSPSLSNTETPTIQSTIFSTKARASYVLEDNTLVMSDTEIDFNDLSDMDSISNIDASECANSSFNGIDSKQDATARIQDRASVHVRFSKKIQKIKRIKVKDVEKDTKRRWYSKSELVQIAQVVNSIIEMMENETHLAENDRVMEEKYNETRRGLEKSTEIGAWQLFERRREAINSVLVLQDQQQRDNMLNPLALAEGYKAATQEAYHEAIKFGKQDAKEAKKYRLKRRSVSDSGSPKKPAEIREASNDIRRNQMDYSEDLVAKLSVRSDTSEDEEMFDLSVRSLLHLTDESATTPQYNIENLERIGRSRRRLSASHAPSRRFVLATAAIFDRTEKLVEHKKSQSISKRSRLKDQNVVVSWRRNSTRAINTNPSATASDTNLLTAMDASLVDDFDVIDHEFTEHSSAECVSSLTAKESVKGNNFSKQSDSFEENAATLVQPETVDHCLPTLSNVSVDPVRELVVLIQRVETCNQGTTKSSESMSGLDGSMKYLPPDNNRLSVHSDANSSESPYSDTSAPCSDNKENRPCLSDTNAPCSDYKENRPCLSDNLNAVLSQSKPNFDDNTSVWFKVRSSDVRMIVLQDGEVAYLLKNPEKCCVPPPFPE